MKHYSPMPWHRDEYVSFGVVVCCILLTIGHFPSEKSPKSTGNNHQLSSILLVIFQFSSEQKSEAKHTPIRKITKLGGASVVIVIII